MEPPVGSVHDLAQLPTLDAKALLEHIKARYHNHMIYVSGEHVTPFKC
jgi:myosin heavy subunit